jgi:hypothetical protein
VTIQRKSKPHEELRKLEVMSSPDLAKTLLVFGPHTQLGAQESEPHEMLSLDKVFEVSLEHELS